ncbi:MAG: hypothetical protein WC579_02880 [Candidatus Paceibacterota bacterium]|nr:hypothetical protein [Candidatus Paceibacterota bacterium]HQM34966.1 hypothetical protein [Candidatus Paceibacterota bacterium]
MSKKLDAIARQKNKPSDNTDVLDLRKAASKNIQEKTRFSNSNELASVSFNEKTSEVSPRLSAQKKLQPIWWTIEKKYAINSWFSIIFFAVIVICSIVAIITSNWIFLAILILGALLFVLLFLKSRKTWYRLTPDGFYVDDDFVSYHDIKYYSILETADKNFIIFETDKLFDKHIFLPFKKEKTVKIREFLNNFLKEKEIKPSLMDLLANLF